MARYHGAVGLKEPISNVTRSIKEWIDRRGRQAHELKLDSTVALARMRYALVRTKSGGVE